ncbi:MAG: dihydroorotate dehydrogenase electron transfer subunit [Bacillota bacterium]
MVNNKYKIIKQEEVIPGHRLTCIEAPEIANIAVPGQFLHIRCGESHDPLLRRPISVHFVNREKVYLLYRIAGKGTDLLARMRPGELLDVIGPLGKGYTLPEKGESVAVLGGGIGIAPLFFLLSQIKKIYGTGLENLNVYFGAATADALPCVDQIMTMGFNVKIATDDGSGGFKGNVLEMAEEELKSNKPARIYSCGPLPMLKGLLALTGDRKGIEVSVEELMGCGLGACLSCICKVKGAEDEYKYAHVCRDGPVFDLRELVF